MGDYVTMWVVVCDNVRWEFTDVVQALVYQRECGGEIYRVEREYILECPLSDREIKLLRDANLSDMGYSDEEE